MNKLEKELQDLKKRVYIYPIAPKDKVGQNGSIWFDYEKNQYYIKIKNKWQLQQLDIKNIDCGEYE